MLLASGRFEREATLGASVRILLYEYATGGTRVPCGALSRFEHDLELHTVGVSKEHRVVPRRVGVFGGSAEDLGADAREVCIQILNALANRHVKGQMIAARRVAVVASLIAIRLGLEEGHRKEVPVRPEDEPSRGS